MRERRAFRRLPDRTRTARAKAETRARQLQRQAVGRGGAIPATEGRADGEGGGYDEE